MVPQGSSNFVDSTTWGASGPGGGTSFGAGQMAGRCHSTCRVSLGGAGPRLLLADLHVTSGSTAAVSAAP